MTPTDSINCRDGKVSPALMCIYVAMLKGHGYVCEQQVLYYSEDYELYSEIMSDHGMRLSIRVFPYHGGIDCNIKIERKYQPIYELGSDVVEYVPY